MPLPIGKIVTITFWLGSEQIQRPPRCGLVMAEWAWALSSPASTRQLKGDCKSGERDGCRP